MAEATLQTITMDDGARLSIRVWESQGTSDSPRRDVLLLHGWPNSGRIWGALVEALLPAASLRIVAPDLRGFGASQPVTNGFTCVRFAQDAIAVAEALSLKDYLLVGHSMSGKVAQVAAAQQPKELAGLALVTPGLLAPSPPVDVSGRVAAHGDATKTRAMVTGWAAHPLSDTDAELLTEDGLRTGREAWSGWLQFMRDEDLSAVADQIAVPTLVIAGGKDPQRTEQELQEGVVAVIRGAEYAVLPGCGHLPQLEDPIALAALLVNFLDRMPVKAAA